MPAEPSSEGAEHLEEEGDLAAPGGLQAAAGDTVPVGGALVAATRICLREVWLMAHAIRPDEDDPRLVYGRFLHAQAYARERHDVSLGASRFDVLRPGPEDLVVLEVKQSDRALAAARLQLGHYLVALEEVGVRARGELRFPEQRRTEEVEIDDALRAEVFEARRLAAQVAARPVPPPAQRVRWCRRCAYASFCWA